MANEKRMEVIVPPGNYILVQDATKGVVKTYTGPIVVNPTAQEVPVIFDPKSSQFQARATLEEAMRACPIADEGSYIVLRNPAVDEKNEHPAESSQQMLPPLRIGSKVVIPGPITFSLWPQQSAEVIAGHHLRSNQYLLIRVYNGEEAKKNWKSAVVKAPGSDAPKETSIPEDISIGKLFIVKGTEVSFYIPPTGVEVLKEGDSYIREAQTLEALEYSILVDEDGNKRYEKGPAVVFPEPTEQFMSIKDEKTGALSKKTRAIELNDLSGLHLKVIQNFEEIPEKDYEEIIPDGTGATVQRKADEKIVRKAGEELFVTGKQTTIFYPSEQLAFVKYDGGTKTFAVSVPLGEGRYVLNRITGAIDTLRGPRMLMPDPRTHVIVRRALTDDQVQLWYPGNLEALEWNRSLQEIQARSPTTRSGAISEGDLARSMRGGAGKNMLANRESLVSTASVMNYQTQAGTPGDSSRVGRDQVGVGDEFTRSSGYTKPRTIQLNTKYEGAPAITVWTGYAVQVVSKGDKREVVKGPKTILLNYDESLEALSLSTGKPKTTDNLFRTVYLKTDNNKVSDYIDVETADHVKVQVYVSYLVNFEGDSSKWFSVENYVKLFADHCRSMLKGAVQKIKIEDFYSNSTDIIRDVLLGKSVEGKRPGLFFDKNNMRVTDVDVLRVTIANERIRALLDEAQHIVVSTNIEMATMKRNLEVTQEKERIAREDLAAKSETVKVKNKLLVEQAYSELTLILSKISNEVQAAEERKKAAIAEQEVKNVHFDAEQGRTVTEAENLLKLKEQEQEQKIEFMKEEAEAVVRKFSAALPGFSEALLALSNNETMQKVAESWNIQRALGGESVSDALSRIFGSTPLAGLVGRLTNPQQQIKNGNGAPVKPSAEAPKA